MQNNMAVWIVDFGSQYTQLITRTLRELGEMSVIITVETAKENFSKNIKPKALILSGGPQSVFEDKEDYSFFFKDIQLPILGVCYGMQLIGRQFGGVVEKGVLGEYGHSSVHFKDEVWGDIPRENKVWMSHSDHLTKVPENFKLILESDNKVIAGIKHESYPWVGLQFHPEVKHSENGKEVIEHFLKNIAGLSCDWSGQNMLETCLETVKNEDAGDVLCAFSGGVDSLVAATLAHIDLKDKLHCFFVDNGLLRPQDYHHIETLKNETPLNISIIDAKEIFYKKLKGVKDPEEKRKVIGHTFIEVFEAKVHEYEDSHGIQFTHLLQGTLYPDVIESISPHDKGGKSATIKSHHNVGGLPETMKLKLMEPLRFLFKDEVRKLGAELGLEHNWVHRHPFPGPGLGVRILGEVTLPRVKQVQQADQILFEELNNANLYDNTWQAFVVHLPVKTVGVKGDGRAYEEVMALRLVDSTDGMTAIWSALPFEFFSKVSNRIANEVAGITRVVLDITSKPPGTIEWE